MEPLKAETDALREVMFTPVENFVSDKERAEKGDEKAEALAHKRMFASAIKAVDKARGGRTLWMVVMEFGTSSYSHLAFGPYATKAQADKARPEMVKTFGARHSAVVPMRNAEGFAQMVEELDKPSVPTGDWAEVAKDREALKNGWKGKANNRHNYLREESA